MKLYKYINTLNVYMKCRWLDFIVFFSWTMIVTVPSDIWIRVLSSTPLKTNVSGYVSLLSYALFYKRWEKRCVCV